MTNKQKWDYFKDGNFIVDVELRGDMNWLVLKELCTKLSRIKGFNFVVHPKFNEVKIRNKGLRQDNFEPQTPTNAEKKPTSAKILPSDDILPEEIKIVKDGMTKQEKRD